MRVESELSRRVEPSELSVARRTLCWRLPAWPAAALTTSQLVAASTAERRLEAAVLSKTRAQLEPSGLTLVGEQLGILLVGDEITPLSINGLG